MKYFKFELKKFILNKRNRYLLALISSLIIVYSVYNTISFTNIFKITSLALFKRYRLMKNQFRITLKLLKKA